MSQIIVDSRPTCIFVSIQKVNQARILNRSQHLAISCDCRFSHVISSIPEDLEILTSRVFAWRFFISVPLTAMVMPLWCARDSTVWSVSCDRRRKWWNIHYQDNILIYNTLFSQSQYNTVLLTIIFCLQPSQPPILWQTYVNISFVTEFSLVATSSLSRSWLARLFILNNSLLND